jgi:membrane protein implicated in regulation of membrane protease activity
MLVAILLIVLILLAVIVLGMWGIATVTTGATLAASNATLSAANLASQTVVLLLSCVLIAMLPLAIYGAVRLGARLRERQHRNEVAEQSAAPIQIAQPQPRLLGEGRVIVMQLPERAQSPRVVRRARRATRPMRQAVRLTQRWFT